MLTHYPLSTKAITSAGICGAGDLLCQNITKEEGTSINFKRAGIFSLVGLVYIGPILHVNYSYMLPTIVPHCAKTPSHIMAAKKLLFD